MGLATAAPCDNRVLSTRITQAAIVSCSALIRFKRRMLQETQHSLQRGNRYEQTTRKGGGHEGRMPQSRQLTAGAPHGRCQHLCPICTRSAITCHTWALPAPVSSMSPHSLRPCAPCPGAAGWCGETAKPSTRPLHLLRSLGHVPRSQHTAHVHGSDGCQVQQGCAQGTQLDAHPCIWGVWVYGHMSHMPVFVCAVHIAMFSSFFPIITVV